MDTWSFSVRQANSACVLLCIPDDPAYRKAADAVNKALLEKYGWEAPVCIEQSLSKLPEGFHVIAFGCLADNPAIRECYFRYRTLADRWYPGEGRPAT